MENSRQGLLDRYSFNRLLTCTCPQDFLNGTCNMDWKLSIVFYHFTGVPPSNMLFNLYTFNELIIICSLRYLFLALPQVSDDLNDLHWLKFHTWAFFKKSESDCESNCTECVYLSSCINMMITLYISYIYFYICHDYSVYFSFLNVNFRLNRFLLHLPLHLIKSSGGNTWFYLPSLVCKQPNGSYV